MRNNLGFFWQCMLFVCNAQVIVWNNFLYFQGPKAAPRMKPGKNSPKKKTKKTKKNKINKKKKPWQKRENVSDLVAIGFDLTSDCLRGWRGFFFRPITERSKARALQLRSVSNTQWKLAFVWFKSLPKDFLEFQKLPLWFRRTMHCQRNSCLFHPASWSWSRKNTPMAGGKVNYRYRDYTYSMYFLFFVYVMSRGGLMIMSLYFRLETLSSRLNEVIVFSLIANLSATTQCS